MPNVPTYIREEDYTLYLEAKKNGWSEFIHAALNDLPLPVGPVGFDTITTDPKTINQVKPTTATITRPPVPAIPGLTTADKIASNGTCKLHGLALDSRGRCMQKGCKYA